MIKREMLVMMHYDALETPALNQQGNAGESGEDFLKPWFGPNLTHSVRSGTSGRFVISFLMRRGF